MSTHTYWFVLLAFALATAAFTGCSSSSDSSVSDSGQDMNDLAAMLDKPEPVAPAVAEERALADQSPIEQPAEAPLVDETSAAAQASSPGAAALTENRTVAGRAPIGEGGYFVAIGGARRQILNRIEDLAWTQGVQHFQATEGRLPRDHAEFMSKIVEPLGIDLGFKEEDQDFLYDPNEGQWGTVFVVAKEPAPAE